MNDITNDPAPVTVRFAPSPTGYIHIGNARTALFNWLLKLRRGGRFILRYDDTDVARSKVEYADAILRDLAWLGIRPDEVQWQSKRFDRYEAAAGRLKKAGLLYACYETAEELELKRKILLGRKLPPVYGREALKLTDAQRAAFEAEGRRPHWRFLLPNFDSDPFKPKRTEVHWDDMVLGRQTVDLASLSDPVLQREDGTWLYTLPSVVDDIEMGITHIVRGSDHVTNTAVQIAIFNALAGGAPAFGHHNLLTTASGEGLSKRTGALSIGSLAEAGHEPMAVASLAVLTGTSEAIEPMADMPALAAHFRLDHVSKSSSKFDPADLDAMTAALLHSKPFEAVAGRLAVLGIAGPKAEAFWLSVRRNCAKVADAAFWWGVLSAMPDDAEALTDDDRAFACAAFDLLPEGEPDHATWGLWTKAVQAATGRKGRALFMPLRLALTGRAAGPELADLLPLMGRAGILARRP
ncbi:MAG: glutamate--tRNA ligase [Rhizobiaceae bacterium]|jgi:glutamyl-tRNA synthetase|nr:glutamate--tRNA ligase [Rhizobiaceae bacterium]